MTSQGKKKRKEYFKERFQSNTLSSYSFCKVYIEERNEGKDGRILEYLIHTAFELAGIGSVLRKRSKLTLFCERFNVRGLTHSLGR
ncbi:hypothetical protein MUP77_01670 [Candidatus Bathyarchaeota archaeon]|nr:hypothetical protein [Candidatus Bathyarchaeota archaeon]